MFWLKAPDVPKLRKRLAEFWKELGCTLVCMAIGREAVVGMYEY